MRRTVQNLKSFTWAQTCLWGLIGLLLAPGTRALAAGDEVIVIYNLHVPESKEVADYYAKKRNIPASQVFGFSLPTSEDISRADFKDLLQKPLAEMLKSKKLWHIGPRTVMVGTNQATRTEKRVDQSKIRYAVICYGVPVRITRDNSIKETAGEQLRQELKRNEAAVDSELALLPLWEQKLPLLGPLSNPIYTMTNRAWLHPTNSVLMVTRLDGPSASVAKGLVDKALIAESEGLWGRAYFDLRNINDPAYKSGDDWIRNASEICRHLGFETVVDEKPGTFPVGFPMSQIAYYVGWYDQAVSGPFTQPKVEFMPGAFAYHLHSFSAASIRTSTENWVGPLLAKGATATMGCVFEPYLGGTPDIGVFTARFLYYGFSFGEAAYASQPVLSWQTTVVGDPLYQPYTRKPDELERDLEQQHSKLREWAYLRLVDLNLANHRPAGTWVTYLEDLPMTKESAVLTEKLGDLYAAVGKPSSAAYAYEQALKLEPSPQQRIRLRLALGEKLTELGRAAEAYDSYQTLLKEAVNYPDRNGVYYKLLLLAHKLNKKAEAEYYEDQIRLNSHG